MLTTAALACAAAALLASRSPEKSVRAGTALELDVSAMMERADLVVEGRVQSATPRVASRGRIETEYLLTVDRTFWGEDQGTRAITIPGGVLPDGRGMIVPGMPRLVPGEDVLLMLSERGATGVRVPIGLSQGKFRLVPGQDGIKLAVRTQGRLSLVSASSQLVRHADSASVMAYADLVAELESAAALKRARLGDSGARGR
jgi:hypothetical protein